ncbi:MAG TPA: TIGR02266 family protein [Polyangia bacterium]|nr:TIGR02266 family protein [Polyangia bacterium]
MSGAGGGGSAGSSGRKLTRVPIQLEVEYRTTGNFLVAYSTNLSKGGLFLQTAQLLPMGASLMIKIHVPGVDDPIDVDATVAWVRAEPTDEGHPAGMGLEFTGMEARYGEVIDRVVASFKGLRILVVGGPGPARSLVGRHLRSIVSCDILELGAEGTLSLAAQQADLVVIDVESTGKPGHEAVRSIKRTLKTPVIALAASDLEKVSALAAGADEVLSSPPSFSELQSSVIRALARPVRVG